mmetsp:Transcript_10958/g.27144  ORF Transcript_10958/g.27144 Transcript_10958/m.27144 type:complete len:277 (+) Transcript_10958:4327-5157(+)
MHGCSGNGTKNDPQCLPCEPCEEGWFIETQCSGYSPDSRNRTCASCGQCSPGQFILNKCNGSGVANTQTCEPCTTDCGLNRFIEGFCEGTGTSNTATCSDCSACETIGALRQYNTLRCPGTLQQANQLCAPCQCPSGEEIVVECSNGENHVCAAPTTPAPPTSSPPPLPPVTPPPTDPETSTPPPSGGEGGGGLSTGAIIGVGIGATLGVGGLATAAVFFSNAVPSFSASALGWANGGNAAAGSGRLGERAKSGGKQYSQYSLVNVSLMPNKGTRI